MVEIQWLRQAIVDKEKKIQIFPATQLDISNAR